MAREDRRPQIMYAFGLSLVFVVIDAAVFCLLAQPLGEWLPIRPIWLNNCIHPALLALIGTLLGCSAFGAFRQNPKLIPMAYSFFPAYMLVCYAYACLNLEGEDRIFACQIITLYMLAPTLIGMGGSWLLYGVKMRFKRQRSKNE